MNTQEQLTEIAVRLAKLAEPLAHGNSSAEAIATDLAHLAQEVIAKVVKRQEAAYDAHDLVEDISEKAEQLLAAIKAGNLHEAGWRIACARGATIELRVNIELHGVKA